MSKKFNAENIAKNIEETVSSTHKIEIISRSFPPLKDYECKNCGSGAIRKEYDLVLLKKQNGDIRVEKRNTKYFCNKCKIKSGELYDIIACTNISDAFL